MPLNIRRVFAYLLDIAIVSLLASAISMSPLNPYKASLLESKEEYNELVSEYEEKLKDVDKEDTDAQAEVLEEYSEKANPLVHYIEKKSLFEVIYYSVCSLIYFGLFAFILDSQTLGKKLMGLAVRNKDETKVPLWKMILRTVFITELPFTLVNLILAYVLGSSAYVLASGIIYYLTFFYETAFIGTIIIRKDGRGMHDLILGTKVVDIKRKGELNG